MLTNSYSTFNILYTQITQNRPEIINQENIFIIKKIL
jgi:hypothetical protein